MRVKGDTLQGECVNTSLPLAHIITEAHVYRRILKNMLAHHYPCCCRGCAAYLILHDLHRTHNMCAIMTRAH